MTKQALHPSQLYKHCDPGTLGFKTTAEITSMKDGFGQRRAYDAIRFGIGINHEGYNLYVSGPSGAGKHRFVRHVLEKELPKRTTPADWAYLHNFDKPNQPHRVCLTAGSGAALKKELEQLILHLLNAIPDAFESDVYQAHINEIEQDLVNRRDEALGHLRKEAQKDHIDLIRTPKGFAFVPMHDNKVIDSEGYNKLPPEEQKRIETAISYLQEKLQAIMLQIPKWQQEGRERVHQLNEEVTENAIGYYIDDLRRRYENQPAIQQHLDAVQQDVVENVEAFREHNNTPISSVSKLWDDLFLRRYLINVIVENPDSSKPPVVYEVNPSHDKLLGKAEHISQMGTLFTDFTLIKPGALHDANGGYLILDARKVLIQPGAWDALKRSISSRQIKVESLGQSLGLLYTQSLEPQPIELDAKVILLGDRLTYHLLCELDPDFVHLFKVAADFEDEIDRSDDNTQRLSQLVARQCQADKLCAFSAPGVARIVEHASRMVEDSEKLATHMGQLTDLLREADYWARDAERNVVEAEDVQRALDELQRRHSRVADHYRESILRGSTIIKTKGKTTGQINALTVIMLGQHAFGHPARITATARAGDGKVIDIEHEAELGGDIHTKGVLIMSQYLSNRYARSRALSLSASVVFEQSYDGIDGDSASMAELCALLSAISEIPLTQNLAITGSVDQQGNTQAIGGVNEKIEGFFEICQARGLSGEQGVIIPAANIPNLMLKQEVIQAAQNGQFHIYPVKHLDEAMELLTGLSAGQRQKDGTFPAGSINAAVESELLHMADIHAGHEHPHQEKSEDGEENRDRH